MSFRIKEINFHITEFCEGHCPMCYATDEDMKRKHGDIENLKKIVHNAIKYGKVERFVMVGGDPCEYPFLVDLLKYIKKEGKNNGTETKTMVISNTHDYKENGKNIEIEEVTKYLDGMCFTVHADNAKDHDKFNGCPGSYEHAIKNLKTYANVKNKGQKICIIVNLTPQTINSLEEIMLNTNKALNGGIDGFALQRIAPIGRACGVIKYFIEQDDVNYILKIIKKMKDSYDFFWEIVDPFPLCIVNPEYRDIIPKGGCNWGIDRCAVFYDGSISRCAMSEKKLSTNMLELNSEVKFQNFWNNDRDLINFRNKEHLDNKCKECGLLEQCGGACVLARKTGDPYIGEIPQKGHDYLAKR